MRTSRIFFAVLAFIALTGFDTAKFDKIIANCVHQGNARDHCMCGYDLFEDRLGDEFMEAVYLQVTGQSTAYEQALMSIIGKDPGFAEQAAAAEAEAKEKCLW